MFAHRSLIPFAALFVASVAFADAPASGTATPSTTPATSTTASTPARPMPMHVVGTVKSLNAARNQVVVTINGADRTFNFANLAHSPEVRVGAKVDVTYTGSTASAITLHK